MTPFTITKSAAILCLFVTATLSIIGMAYVARLDAELPEPETAKWSSSTVIPQLIFNITFDTHADAAAWLAWWKEQVAEW
jgi:hypothetical protein